MNNRIFKFRIWHHDRKEFLYPSFPIDSSITCRTASGERTNIPAIITLDGRVYHEGVFQNVTIQQFTGLADYTGTDIYEGDIIQETYKSLDPTKTIPNTYSWEDGCVWKEDVRIYEVKYTPPSFNIFSRLGPCKDFYRKIVGNIFQNQNLITS